MLNFNEQIIAIVSRSFGTKWCDYLALRLVIYLKNDTVLFTEVGHNYSLNKVDHNKDWDR